jgi:TIR domain-containing protein
MKIFICWSGTWGKNAAEQIKEWLCKEVLLEQIKDSDVLVSEDIAKGTVWFEELSNFLDQASVALVCLTRDALRSPWVHYEVGAIAKALREKQASANAYTRLAPVFTLLLGVKPGEIDGPLAAFQSTSADNEKDMRRLIDDLTLVLPVDQRPTNEWNEWRDALNQRWPDTWKRLRERLKEIAMPSLLEVFPDFDRLFRRKTFQEPTLECVNQKWQERYDGARDTWANLQERQGTIEQTCLPYVVDMYKALVATVDQYAMAVSLLVGAKKFDIDDHGHVEIEPPGIAEACERSRKRIKSLVARLTDPFQVPRFEEVFRFEVAESVSEKKSLIHRRAPDVKNEAATILDVKNEQWQTSDWDYDRIIYSLCLQKRVKNHNADLKETLSVALEHAMTDLEKARAREETDAPPEGSHLMSLSYALTPLECAPRGTSFERLDDLQYLVSSIRDLLRRGQRARAGRPDGNAATTFESFEAVLDDSLKRIERVFGLAPEGAATDAISHD